MDQEIVFEIHLRDISLNPEILQKSWNAWQRLKPFLPIPYACMSSDGVMIYYWDWGKHYLDLEISLEEPLTFFYRNHEIGDYWGLDWTTENVPAAIQEVVSWMDQG